MELTLKETYTIGQQKQSWIDFLPEPFDFKIHIEDLGGNREGVFAREAGQ